MHLRSDEVTIYYLLGDDPSPSWGAGLIYHHVRLLREHGFDARVLHQTSPYRPAWVDVDVPVSYLNDPRFTPGPGDVVVAAEVMAADPAVHRYPWRRIVFVQGSFLIHRGLGGASDYAALGFEAAMAVMPHVARVIERHFGIKATIVPPFVAPYFVDAGRDRERRILFSAKPIYRLLGISDHEIALALLTREIAKRPGWTLLSLENFTHRRVAELMQTSMFLVNVNSHESFNATVPEAMATGCIPVCYEATGGRDYLRDGENAIVFDNQQVYAIVEKVCDLMDGLDAQRDLLDRLRLGARETMKAFTPQKTAEALVRFFGA